jgi:hybrid cluster-associated redox disulfide protein
MSHKSDIGKIEKGRITMQVTKQSIIGDILDYDRETAQFFFAIGMHCLGCPASRGESVEDACAVHGTDADALIAEINRFLESKK